MTERYPTYVDMVNYVAANGGGAAANGLPVGGTAGEVLTKASATDYDATWSTVSAANGLPVGGTAGQSLIKNSATNYDAGWSTPAGILPVGGTVLQLLVKAGAADYSASWANFNDYAASYSQPVKGVRDTTQRTSSSNTTFTATGLTFTVASGNMYHLKALGSFTSAATTTGLSLGFSTTVATTYCGWNVSIEQAAAGTDSTYVAHATALGTVLTSTGVVAINTAYQWEIEARFQPSAAGTITIGFRSEVNASQITWQAGAMATLTTVA